MARILVTNPPDARGPVLDADGHEHELPDIVAEVTTRAATRGRAEREWLTDWRQMYVAASAQDDEETLAMLLDVLYAFDAWLASRRPTRLRRIS